MPRGETEVMYQSILEDLYQRYYQGSGDTSSVTSSFWHDFGGRHAVTIEDGQWKAMGFGIGYFVTDTWGNAIRHFPETLLSKQLLAKHQCATRLAEIAYTLARLSGRRFVFDCAKQVLAVNEIRKGLAVSMTDPHPFRKRDVRVVCVIGDGYGYCTSILKRLDPELTVISINLGRSLFFDVLYSKKCLTEERPAIMTAMGGREDILGAHTLIFLEAENYQYLSGLPVDLFINITSMQEMEPGVVDNYFRYMRESSADKVHFYCCNRLEKRLPDSTLVNFHDYPWNNSTVLMDELCAWHQRFPSSGIPVWRKFDGPHQHRFVRLK